MRRQSWLLGTVVALLLIVGPAAGGQGGSNGGADLAGAIAVQERHTPRLLAVPGVVGTGVSLDESGRPEIVVLLEASDVAGLPSALDGISVSTKVTGPVSALHHREGHEKGGGNGGGGGGGDEVDLTQRFDRPVPIGVSSGNAQSEVDGIVVAVCSAGTYGARVVDAGGTVYALSNNHVYAHENLADPGSAIVQPGLAETNCIADPNDAIGSLHAFVPLQPSGNRADAAIAISTTSLIGDSTPADGYGTPKSQTVAAEVGMAVQKYGRTTNLTTGAVDVVNLTVIVQYTTGPKVFEGQIGVEASRGNSFVEGGDSGSLMVTNTRESVGLVFAGNDDGSLGVANPIDEVLGAFGVTIDGA